MSNRPIPRKGLLGCWFLDDRGIAYDAGQNQAIDRSGRGNHATYKNGVTVGVEGDPSRDFGAADFDDASNQRATVADPLAVNGEQAIAAISKTDVKDAETTRQIFSNGNSSRRGVGFGLLSTNDLFFRAPGANRNSERLVLFGGFEKDTYISAVGFFDGSQVGLYVDNVLRDIESISAIAAGIDNATIGCNPNDENFWNGEIAAVARYDLTVPNAPEPSEIARKWDKLRDIPATR